MVAWRVVADDIGDGVGIVQALTVDARSGHLLRSVIELYRHDVVDDLADGMRKRWAVNVRQELGMRDRWRDN